VTSATKRNGVEDPWNGETVAVRREYVSSIERKVFSPARSLLAGGAFAALGGVFYAALGGGAGGGKSGSGGQPGAR
jgi:hypothetical protein